jgi:hypothetical protein
LPFKNRPQKTSKETEKEKLKIQRMLNDLREKGDASDADSLIK